MAEIAALQRLWSREANYIRSMQLWPAVFCVNVMHLSTVQDMSKVVVTVPTSLNLDLFINPASCHTQRLKELTNI